MRNICKGIRDRGSARKNRVLLNGKSENALFRHLGEEFSDLKIKADFFLREHLKCFYALLNTGSISCPHA